MYTHTHADTDKIIIFEGPRHTTRQIICTRVHTDNPACTKPFVGTCDFNLNVIEKVVVDYIELDGDSPIVVKEVGHIHTLTHTVTITHTHTHTHSRNHAITVLIWHQLLASPLLDK